MTEDAKMTEYRVLWTREKYTEGDDLADYSALAENYDHMKRIIDDLLQEIRSPRQPQRSPIYNIRIQERECSNWVKSEGLTRNLVPEEMTARRQSHTEGR